MTSVRAFVAFVQADFHALGHLPDDPGGSQEGLVTQAAGQAAEDMEDQGTGGHDLCFDRVVLLLAAIGKFARNLVLGLRNRLLGGVEQDFLELGMGLQEFFEGADPEAFRAGSGSILRWILRVFLVEVPQGSVA